MGCAVACVAFRCEISYSHALEHFTAKENAWMRGYYCEEVVEALARAGYRYEWEAFDASRHQLLAEIPGTIIFLAPNEKYPAGHYLVRAQEGWMNPWTNYPRILPVEATFHDLDLAGVSFIIFETRDPSRNGDRPTSGRSTR